MVLHAQFCDFERLERQFGVRAKPNQPDIRLESSRGVKGFVARDAGGRGRQPLYGAHAVVRTLVPAFSVPVARAQAAHERQGGLTGGKVTGSLVEKRVLRVCDLAAADPTGVLRIRDAADLLVTEAASHNEEWVEAVGGLRGWALAAVRALAERGLTPVGSQVVVGAKYERVATAIDLLCADASGTGLVVLELKTGYEGYADVVCGETVRELGSVPATAALTFSVQALIGQMLFVRMTSGTHSPYTRPGGKTTPVRALTLLVNNRGARFVEPHEQLLGAATLKAIRTCKAPARKAKPVKYRPAAGGKST